MEEKRFTSYVNEKDRGRKRVEGNLITRSFVWWHIGYPLPFQWKGEKSHGGKRKEKKGFGILLRFVVVPEKKRSKRIFGTFAFGFCSCRFILEDSIYRSRKTITCM